MEAGLLRFSKMKRTSVIVLAVFAFLFSLFLRAEDISLTQMDLSKAYQQYGVLQVNKSVTGDAAYVAGTLYSDVIGVHSKSVIKLDLKKHALRFKGLVGVADNKTDYTDKGITTVPLADGKRVFYHTLGNEKFFAGIEGENGTVDRGEVIFRVLGDGRELYASGIISQGDTPKEIDLDLKGIEVLELTVDSGEKGFSGDHALWIHPVIEYTGVAPVVVDADYTQRRDADQSEIQQKLRTKVLALPSVEWPLSRVSYDWLIHSESSKAGVYSVDQGTSLVLANDLVARVFRITPDLATMDIVNRMTEENMLRAVSPEGFVSINGENYSLGGLSGQPERGYIKREWLEQMQKLTNSFHVIDFEISDIQENIHWARSRWALNKTSPTGKVLTFVLAGPEKIKDVTVKLHYALYDRLPVIRKSMEVFNGAGESVKVDSFKLESLAFSEPESPVEETRPDKFRLPNIHVESNYGFHGFTEKEADKTENWVIDPDYSSQCNYPRVTPCILEVKPPLGPGEVLEPGSVFSSFDVYEMPLDSDDRERQGLFKRRMYTTIAPWVTENPIFLHLTSTDPEVVKRAVDQCAEVGYEMIILSFGSGLNMEKTEEEYYAHFKEFVDYAKSKGIEMGGYSLLSSRWISDEVDVINPKTGKRGGMIFGSSPCLCSDWGYDYFDKIKTFFTKTGMTVFEHDGSYPGNVCASTNHTYHVGLEDSQWKQFQKITELYRWMCENGIYINVPDFYLLSGSTKVGIGYRETNWSLPRDRQLIHGRQINFMGTYDRPASACWTFVPLVQYHGGGAAATLEPLSEHLDAYRMHMIQNYGAAVQACYRGPRLYDTDETKAVVKETIAWYKKYRNILNSDIIHLRKADGRDWDGFLHVNPNEKEKGFALLFNPLDEDIERNIRLPLYYTGLSEEANIREGENPAQVYKLNRDYTVELKVKIPANGCTWFVIE